MPRRTLLRNDSLPYHVTARVNNRERFHAPLGLTWDLCGFELFHSATVYGSEIQAFVLMPNHFHLLITVPQSDLGTVMRVFMSDLTRASNRATGRTGHLFGGPYHWSLINGSRYFGHALKYVYRNPVRGGLCDRVEDYPFSTLNGLLGATRLPFPIHFTRVGMELGLPSAEPHRMLEWLNQPFPQEAEALIQKGLRRKKFSKILDRSRRIAHPELESLI